MKLVGSRFTANGLHRCRRDARTHTECLARGVLERRFRRQVYRGCAQTLVREINAGRSDAFIHQRLGGPQQAMAP
jgi:hypothetical protein